MKLIDTVTNSMKKSIVGFFERNGSVIASALCLAVFTAVGKEMGLIKDDKKDIPRAPVRTPQWYNTNSPNHLEAATNSYEQSMGAFWRNGVDAWSDSSKIEAAKGVRNIALSTVLPEHTLSYAIKVIEKISQTAWSDSSKNKMNDFVYEIITKGKRKEVVEKSKPIDIKTEEPQEPEIETELEADDE